MPDVLHTAGVFMPARALGAAGPGLGEIVAINRVQRALREDVLDVHQQQFLVLLLMLQAEADAADDFGRSEEHTSELQSLMRISYAVFCLKKKKINTVST